LDLWRAILAWQRKKEDLAKEQEWGQDRLEALEGILQDTEHRAKTAFASFATDSNDIEQSITNAIEEEYNLLCQHPTVRIDGDGQMLQCCVHKHLFHEMLGELPKLPVRKQSD
jgi:hypothetical protein